MLSTAKKVVIRRVSADFFASADIFETTSDELLSAQVFRGSVCVAVSDCTRSFEEGFNSCHTFVKVPFVTYSVLFMINTP